MRTALETEQRRYTFIQHMTYLHHMVLMRTGTVLTLNTTSNQYVLRCLTDCPHSAVLIM